MITLILLSWATSHNRQSVGRSTEPSDADTVMAFEALKRTPREDARYEALYLAAIRSERPDVLAWVRSNRVSSRRLSKPNVGMSATLDTDGDGLPDAVDANPYAAPRKLTDAERMLGVAFEWQAHEYGLSDVPALVTFPKGNKPFEIFGWPGAVIPDTRRDQAKLPLADPGKDWPYVIISLSVHSPQKRSELVGKKRVMEMDVDYGVMFASLAGNGSFLRIRKIRGEWYVVRVQQTWVS